MQLKEEAVFTLKFDGKPVINELGELEKRLIDVKEAQKSVERGTKEWADNKAEIKALEASIKSVREEMGVSGMTVQQLKGYYKQLSVEIEKLTPGTEAYKEKASDLKSVNDALANHRQTIRGVADEIDKQPSLWERAKAGVLTFFAAFGAMELLQRAFSFVKDGIKSALELSDTMGKVAKATGLAAEDVQTLADELDKVDTRTTKEGLLEITQIGGQLGVANDELLGFVKSVDMAAVALGDEFSGGAEEAASKLGSLKKLFTQTDELTYGDALNRIGSAINELGADGSATGPVIADFTARIGQLGDLAPEITQTMGLGAAFQELGLTAEIAAGGVSNILLTAAKDTATFAQQLRYTEEQFKKIINTDPNRFLLELADSFKNVPADQLAKRLDDLGIKSQEATKVMALLKDQTGLVTDKQELANKSFAEGTSLQKEFTTMNTTAAAEYDKSQKALALISTEIGQGLLPAITTGTRGIITFVNILRSIPEFISENKNSFAALGLAILAFNGHLIKATALSLADVAAKKVQSLWTTSTATATALLNATMIANPVGVVVAAIALLVAGLIALYNNSSTVRGIISGTWEAMKAGVSVLSDISDWCITWIQKGLEPIRPALETVGGALKTIWGVIESGIDWFSELTSSASTFVSGGLSRISNGLEPVRSALAEFWKVIDTGITKIKSIGSTISSFLHVDDIVTKVKSAAGQIGDAFNKGYGDKLSEDQPKQLATHQQGLDKKKTAEQKTATELVTVVTESEQKAIDKKAAQNEKHRESEAKKAAEAAKKEAEEQVRANNEALKKIEDVRIASIKDDLEREVAKIRQKRDLEVEAMMASKASSEVKAVFETAMNAQMLRDIEKAESDHLKKKEKEDGETAKRILDLKIKLSGDEKADKLQKLDDVATAQRAQIQKDITDDTEKARLLKQVNDNLIRDKEKVEQDYRRKKEQEEKSLQDQLYQANLSDLSNRLTAAGTNAKGVYEAKKAMLDAEYQHNKQKLEREAADQKAHNEANIADTDRRAAANKATDDKLKADLTSNDKKYETDKTELTKEKTEARRKNQAEYFDAIKALMDGDFKTFTDLLTKKLMGEKKQLTESQQKQIDTIDQVGQYTVLATQALMKLSQMKLDKELSNIKKEKDSQLATWKDKYDSGVINKETYEKEVERINKEADQKNKQAQLDAFKRQQKLDIAMAVINGAQAALKSLAMLGWPLGLFAVAGAAITTGIQVALIKSQKPPSLAKGGKISNAGVPDGPRHGQKYGESGLSITRRDTGEEVAEMEGGEPIMVLSRNTYANNRKVVDSLLHSSLHRNGAPVMRQGGIFGSDGGSYGDLLRKGGLRQFADGGWMEQINDESSGGSGGTGDSGGGYSDPGGSSEGGSYGGSASDAEMKAQLDASQQTQDDIAKNTLAAAKALEKALLLLADLQAQLKLESTNQQTALVNQMTGLRTDISTQLQALQFAMHTDMTALQGTMKVELPSLGTDLLNQLDSLRTSLVLSLIMVRNGIGLDVTNLQKATLTGLDTLTKSLHTDLLQLDTNVDASLTTLATSVHTDLSTMQLAQTLQQNLLRDETKVNFTTLQTILTQELDLLRQATHADLDALATSNSTELRTVQGILTGSRNEQGYHSTLLRIISEKNLSVQTFVNVFNQIDVVVNKSDLK